MNALRIALLIVFGQLSQQTATIQGTVSKPLDGGPISGARVDLIRQDGTSPQTYSTVAEPDGSFTISNARPGAYRLAAARTGYLRREFGQRSRTGVGLTLDLEPGQQLRNLNIELRTAAAITGRVTDRQGDAVATREVRALVPFYRDGKRMLGIVQSTFTNDQGDYRLFGLPAGQYFVSAMPPGSSALTSLIVGGTPAPGASVSVINETFTAVYYPGTTDSRIATAVDVTSGGDYGGVNITIVPLKTHHIRGVVPGGMANVTLVPGDPGITTLVRTVPAAAGPFDFPNIASGEYTLVARSGEMLGLTAVNVREDDLDNVVVGLSLTAPVPARVHFEDRKPGQVDPDLDDVNFNLLADPPIPGAAPDVYAPFPDGSFTPGVLLRMDYRITNLMLRAPGATIPTRIRDAYIKSIAMGTRDALNDGIRIDDPEKISPVEIVLGLHPGMLSGAVLSEKQKPEPNATVLLVPNVARRRWADNYRTVTTDLAGRYVIDRIPPGDYSVFSWEEIEDGTWMDPDFMKKYEGRGIHVHINEGNNPPVSITAIP